MPLSRALRLIIVGFSLAVLVLSAAAPVSAGGPASRWRVGYYTPSTPGTLSMSAAQQGGGIATFDFTDQPNTALLATDHGSFKGQLLGDLTGSHLTATFDISGATGAFTYFGEGTPENPCGTPASVRFYFATDNGGGFAFTHYWWSNPESQVLSNGHWTLTATVEPVEWSDWNGQNGATQTAGFADAASNVTLIGLSFGGGCFFENGVGTTDGSGTFQLDSFTAS
ncbi:MAG: hypothetical protein E6J37_12525 [Chloroflexi bacterium]|nr:MAG: hypothetical protein E6J37_12525 [Chloroflexota bacterium]